MTDSWALTLLNAEKDSARVLDCAQRARDFILMEAGREPDAEWVIGAFNDVPPDRTKDDVLMFGVEQPDGSLDGLLGVAPGYETATEWYVGLLLMAEDKRRQGIGTIVLRDLIALAKSSEAKTLKVAVYVDNTDGLRFWQRNGFIAVDGNEVDGRVVLHRQI